MQFNNFNFVSVLQFSWRTENQIVSEGAGRVYVPFGYTGDSGRYLIFMNIAVIEHLQGTISIIAAEVEGILHVQ